MPHMVTVWGCLGRTSQPLELSSLFIDEVLPERWVSMSSHILQEKSFSSVVSCLVEVAFEVDLQVSLAFS